MKPDEILEYCLKNLEGSILVESWGEKGIFYNPVHVLKRGVCMDGLDQRPESIRKYI